MNSYTPPIMQTGSIEFFAENGRAFALIGGIKLAINDWPTRIADMIARDIDRHPGAESALERMGINDPVEKLNQYVLCMYGELNLHPDFINFKPSAEDAEFTQLICGINNCKFRGILCRLIHADYGDLTDREVDICKLLRNDLTVQEIAYRLSISVNTVNTHITNILPKIGVKNSRGIAVWAAHHLTD